MSTKEKNAAKPQQKKVTPKIKINYPCPKCEAAKNLGPCPHRGGGGGGGSDNDESGNKETKKDVAVKPDKVNRPLEKTLDSADTLENSVVNNNPELNKILTFENVAKLLLIANDRQNGVLILSAKPSLSQENLVKLREYLQIVRMEFDQFKDRCEKQRIPVEGFMATLQNDALTIRIPNPTIYNAFLQELSGKNLFTPSLQPQEVQVQKRTTTPILAMLLTPKPKPHFVKDETDVSVPALSVSKKKPEIQKPEANNETEGLVHPENLETNFNPSPFSTQLIPKGWKE